MLDHFSEILEINLQSPLRVTLNPFTFAIGVGYTVLDQGGYIDDWIGNKPKLYELVPFNFLSNFQEILQKWRI